MPPPTNPFNSRQVPWNPSPWVNSPAGYARALGGQGYSRADIEHFLRTSPNIQDSKGQQLRASEISRLATLGERWGARVMRDQMNNPNSKPMRSWMIRNSNLTHAYRYHLIYDFGVDSNGRRVARTVIIDSNQALTYAQALEQGRDAFRQLAARYAVYRIGNVDTDATGSVVHIERRSG